MARGTVTSFDSEKGYGSILPDQSESELFVHESSITIQATPPLKEGQIVYFETLNGPHGEQAIEVRPITIEPPPAEPTT